MSDDPDWMTAGARHVWRPYCQMKTAPPPLPVVRTQGARIVLADGRELVDGIASWWTACHGYNHPHIREAVERQLAVMPHVMFGGLAHGFGQRTAQAAALQLVELVLRKSIERVHQGTLARARAGGQWRSKKRAARCRAGTAPASTTCGCLMPR